MVQYGQIVREKELEERLGWLIFLRWFAVLGVFLVIAFSTWVLRFDLPLVPLCLGNVFLALYNGLCLIALRTIAPLRQTPDWFRRAIWIGNLQIAIDLFLLAYLLYFAGGIENPFVLFFVFHMVIASILLSNRAAYLQASWAVVLLWGLFILETSGLLSHRHLDGFIPKEACFYQTTFIPAFLGVFSVTLFLVVYMATSIVNRMREGERDLAIANEKLAEKDRIKSEYVLKVSHDIQSHLAAIQGCLEVVLKGLTGPLPEKAREMIGRAERRSGFVIRFVKDLLDLSKMRATEKMAREPIPLKEQVLLILDSYREAVESKRLTVSVELSEQIIVWMNRNALIELMGNLIGNAVRYTPEGGRIRVRQESTEKEGFITICVEDTGIGIPEEAIPHIFDDFYRAKNAREFDKEGTGLGLAIVKQIVTSHGGTVRVESRLGEGSRFVVILPKA